jgi:hypothetical protein
MIYLIEFKSQVNVYLKNRSHSLKVLIETNSPQLGDYIEEHWESMKQDEATKNCTMRALVNTPSHFGHGGEVGVVRRLVILLVDISTLVAFYLFFYWNWET